MKPDSPPPSIATNIGPSEKPRLSQKVHFYILSGDDLTRRLHFIYRLVKKLYNKQLTLLIMTADKEQLHRLDRLLWTAEPESFIPHEIWGDSLQRPWPPILLTTNSSQRQSDFQPQVVIDLSYDATALVAPNVVLVANQHQEILPNARMKYQAYLNEGIRPTVHHINN